MLVRTEFELWMDTPAVQMAVTEYHGVHIGFGDFRVAVDGETVLLTRRDSTSEGENMGQRRGFVGRPYVASGPPLALAHLTTYLSGQGHELTWEE